MRLTLARLSLTLVSLSPLAPAAAQTPDPPPAEPAPAEPAPGPLLPDEPAPEPIAPIVEEPAPAEPVEPAGEDVAMTLDELIQLDTSMANLTESTTALTSPGSITTITEEDMRLTPARNLLDLLEVHVPGALWMAHSEGPHPGFRGIIVDRNNKFLLVVNGRVLNQKGHGGAVTELENWELGDIAEINVLRGPGSVTYGPGAIAGVISITTKNAQRSKRTSVRLRSNYPYQANGIAAETSFARDGIEAYLHVSLVATQGAALRTLQVDPSNKAGYLNEEFADQPPLYYRDFDGRPQSKVHLDLRLGKEWNLWARYTSSGATAGSALGLGVTADRFQTGILPGGMPVYGVPETFRALSSRQLTVALNNDHAFSPAVKLKTGLSYYSLDWRRRLAPPLTYLETDPPEIRAALVDRNHARYYRQRFAEDEVHAQSLLHLTFGEIVQVALGGAWAYDYWGPGWGDDRRDFRMGDNSNIISGTDSHSYGFAQYRGVDPSQIWIKTSGFGTHTVSALGEASLRFHRLFGLLLSGRLDKNELSSWLATPRVVLTSQFTERTALRLIWQSAQRMNTAEQLYVEHKVAGRIADPEMLTNYEGILTALLTDNVSASFSGFYNRLGVVAFNQNNLTSPVVGDLELAGGEVELSFAGPRWRGGVNHSFVKQLSWRLRPGVLQSGISYSDYNQPAREDASVVIKGTGNDLNNWANHASKLFVNFRPLPWLTLHLDTRVFWEFEGAKDGLDALEAAAAGTAREAGVQTARDRLIQEDVYGMDFRVNASVEIAFSDHVTFSVYGMNLAGVGDYKRYGYDAGNVQAAPVRTQYVNEPLTLGVSLAYGF